jgi:hypothetical protein
VRSSWAELNRSMPGEPYVSIGERVMVALREGAEAMPSSRLAGWDQAGQPRRAAQPYMAGEWIGIRAAVADMPPVELVPRSRTLRGHGLERRPGRHIRSVASS